MSANMEQREREEWLTVDEVARELRLHKASVYRAVERGDLQALRLTPAGRIRIPAAALERATPPRSTPKGETDDLRT